MKNVPKVHKPPHGSSGSNEIQLDHRIQTHEKHYIDTQEERESMRKGEGQMQVKGRLEDLLGPISRIIESSPDT